MKIDKIRKRQFGILFIAFVFVSFTTSAKENHTVKIPEKYKTMAQAASSHATVAKQAQDLPSFIKEKGKEVSVDDTFLHDIRNDLTLQEVKAFAQTDLWNLHTDMFICTNNLLAYTGNV